jgi:mannose-6-phosphate isomerase-like protein (cupin superfamily)
LLQNQALIAINGSGNPFEGVADLYNLPTLLPNPQSESFQAGGEQINVVATGAETNGQLSLFDVSINPQSNSLVGVHGQADEGFYILNGNASFIVNGETLNASPGTFVYAPAGNTYTLSNSGTSPVQAVLVSAPAGVENHFRNLGAKPVPEVPPTWGLLALGAWGAVSQLSAKRKQ